MDPLLDLSQLAPEQWPRLVSKRFATLVPGRGFVLFSCADPREALLQLQQEHAGIFEWHPLVDGPEEWRVIVARRRGETRKRQVMEFMTGDHHRIHTMLSELVERGRSGDRHELAGRIAHLETGLRKHITWEEEVLFPVISAKLGTPRGPAALLRDEHLLVFELLASLEKLCLQPSRRDELVRLATELRDMLASHAGIEERILYAVTDLLLTEEERDELVRRCQLL